MLDDALEFIAWLISEIALTLSEPNQNKKFRYFLFILLVVSLYFLGIALLKNAILYGIIVLVLTSVLVYSFCKKYMKNH